ncbi:hypothetical protein [Lysinibacillus sp. 3P01SB]|uniref:hypothetical protein n=1 Tax=Lysinibacillus sp. 3P01SB TaxID=3132284 RepID=UPI0039A53458
MRKFWSLVKKEWHMYKAWPIIFFIVGAVSIGLLPMFEGRFIHVNIAKEEFRIGLLFLGLLLIGSVMPWQFLFSIRRGSKEKELWLHNSSPITVLIGAKLFYTVAWTTLISAFYTFFFHWTTGIIDGSTGEIIWLQGLVVSIIFLLGILTSVVALLFYAVYIQLKRYIRYGSVIITGMLFGLFLFAIDKIATSSLYDKLLIHGEIPLTFLEKNMPVFTSEDVLVNFYSLYIVEELAMWLVMAICFIAASKWIERVITR